MTRFRTTTTVLAAAFALACSVSAQAQPIRGRGFVGPRFFAGPRFYVGGPVVRWNPVWDPYWIPYYGYGYGGYPVVIHSSAEVRVEVLPKQTEVYVDGYYAGTAGDFDGVFKHLHTTPGGHAITLHLEGYRTVTQDIYVRPDSVVKMEEKMDKLAAGETSASPPAPARLPVQPPAGPAQ